MAWPVEVLRIPGGVGWFGGGVCVYGVCVVSGGIRLLHRAMQVHCRWDHCKGSVMLSARKPTPFRVAHKMLFLAASFFFFLPHPFDGDGGELVFSSIVNLQNPFTPFGGLFSSFTTKLGQA